MSKYIIKGSRYAAIRPREQTKFLVVHTVSVNDFYSTCSSEDDFLWTLEAIARDASILGHGVHFIVTPEGKVVRDRPDELHGSLNPQWNRSAVFIRVPVIGSEEQTTEAQEAALQQLLEDLEAKYPRASYHQVNGWEVLAQ